MNPQGPQRFSAGGWRDEQLDAAGPRQSAAHGATNGGAKEVSWADDKSIPPEHYTFYREGTPPPSPPDDAGSGFGLSARSGNHDDGYDYTYDRVAPPAPIPHSTIWGFRRRNFWIVVAVIALLVAIGAGVGAGVGVGAVGSKHSAAESQPQTPATTTTTLQSSRASPSSTAASATPTAIAACPAANNTEYLVPGTGKTFLRVCGIDYSGAGQATDLGVVWTASMQDCMLNCAGYPSCSGCGWGVIQGDAGSDHRCWLKGDLQQAHVVRTGWDFAVLQ